ncbi:MAG: sigma-70 family RNA polymerase sigma factor [Candidatus Moduliflexus flocculans]|nr:sigma-70 family RNA polymerase sigma factor [Candidatus Moduliflexus flocculans]
MEATIRDCLEGSQSAWKALVDAYARRIFNMAYQFCGSREEAEDRTQEVFLKLHGALPKYDFGKNFTAWLLTLAKNHLIDEYRRTKWEKTQRDEFDERVLVAAGPHRTGGRSRRRGDQSPRLGRARTGCRRTCGWSSS